MDTDLLYSKQNLTGTGLSSGKLIGNVAHSYGNPGKGKSNNYFGVKIGKINHILFFFRNQMAVSKQSVANETSPVNNSILINKPSSAKKMTPYAAAIHPAERLIRRSAKVVLVALSILSSYTLCFGVSRKNLISIFSHSREDGNPFNNTKPVSPVSKWIPLFRGMTMTSSSLRGRRPWQSGFIKLTKKTLISIFAFWTQKTRLSASLLTGRNTDVFTIYNWIRVDVLYHKLPGCQKSVDPTGIEPADQISRIQFHTSGGPTRI